MTRATGPDCAVMRTFINTHTHTHMTRRNLLVGCVIAMVAGKKPNASTPYLAQGRDGALSLTIGFPTRHWLDPFARVKSSLLLKIHVPSERELADTTTD